MLGSACNFNCRYCLQTNEKIVSPQLNDKTLEFIWSVIQANTDPIKKINLSFCFLV